MDAFYASVEQRDDPGLRGKPVVVAWRGPRSVVCAASYEARKFGVRSAMPAITAERLCPQAIFVPPDFSRYQAVSKQIRQIFFSHTDLVEPLSLDEAYLDVSANKTGLASATLVAETIRAQILATTNLTASAGVAPNKFLAKIASDWRKPDGQFVVKPHQVDAFLAPLPVAKIPGVGKVMQGTLANLQIRTVADLRARSMAELERRYGRYGKQLYWLARGIDHSAVQSDRPAQSISAEETFSEDLRREQLSEQLPALAARVWRQVEKSGHRARTVVLKLKTAEFAVMTRSLTPPSAPAELCDMLQLLTQLLARVPQDDGRRYRLLGVGLSNFIAPNLDLQLRFD